MGEARYGDSLLAAAASPWGGRWEAGPAVQMTLMLLPTGQQAAKRVARHDAQDAEARVEDALVASLGLRPKW
ncbi:hypothetical protein NDU88_002102 [Pleurodeles waltl]|uniref:Uncharacterized protein n=1 Tax=Pleurodeles waltl TaxID=8319 RepID=A0AAV7KRY9_PLEWA|nr:hypothetical protein NDU88_002102 [Pleurodeles waltl]